MMFGRGDKQPLVMNAAWSAATTESERRPTRATRWDALYRDQAARWDNGPCRNEISRLVSEKWIDAERVLEIGCGSGSNAVELGRHAETVTAVDISPLAIQRGRRLASKSGVRVDFIVADVLDLAQRRELVAVNGPFPCVFERCVFNVLRLKRRDDYVQAIADLTQDGGLCVLFEPRAIFDGDERLCVPESAFDGELSSAFEVVELRSFTWNSKSATGALITRPAWSCVLRRLKR